MNYYREMLKESDKVLKKITTRITSIGTIEHPSNVNNTFFIRQTPIIDHTIITIITPTTTIYAPESSFINHHRHLIFTILIKQYRRLGSRTSTIIWRSANVNVPNTQSCKVIHIKSNISYPNIMNGQALATAAFFILVVMSYKNNSDGTDM